MQNWTDTPIPIHRKNNKLKSTAAKKGHRSLKNALISNGNSIQMRICCKLWMFSKTKTIRFRKKQKPNWILRRKWESDDDQIFSNSKSNSSCRSSKIKSGDFRVQRFLSIKLNSLFVCRRKCYSFLSKNVRYVSSPKFTGDRQAMEKDERHKMSLKWNKLVHYSRRHELGKVDS